MVLWLQFIACTGIILVSGTYLSKYGDVIAEKTGLGRTWVGVILMASVTSLPELVTGISSAAIFNVPDIAVGDVLGSCMFNILILAVLDFMSRSAPISTKAHQGQVLTAAFGMFLLGLVNVSLFGAAQMPSVGWVGVYSFVFIAVYLIAMRSVFSYEKKRIAELIEVVAEEIRYEKISKAKAYRMYGLNALLTIGAAVYLPGLGARIAEFTGLGQTFVGNIFIALSTSLPELVVSIATLKIGAIDMAFGNIFGSNLFNILILAVDDLFYTKGPILSHVSANHLVTSSAAIAMTAVAAIGLTYRASKKWLFFAWDSVAILAIYTFALSILYMMR
ncbi:MAG TPA: sodium:calcium antiporter [Candidatus Binatia bacterium]